jgi:hypothetical protein
LFDLGQRHENQLKARFRIQQAVEPHHAQGITFDDRYWDDWFDDYGSALRFPSAIHIAFRLLS